MSKMSDWTYLTGDVDWQGYGATWIREVNGIHWALVFENMEEWGDGAKGYYCDVRRIDLNEIQPDVAKKALDCCGIDVIELVDMYALTRALTLVEALLSYGVYAPMGNETSAWPDRARAGARRIADALIEDDTACQTALNETVNKIGSTAADFGRGDTLAGLRRTAVDVIQRDKKPDAGNSLMLKMFAASGGRTLGGEVEAKLAIAGELLKTNGGE